MASQMHKVKGSYFHDTLKVGKKTAKKGKKH